MLQQKLKPEDKNQALSSKLNQYGLDPLEWLITEQPKKRGEFLISSLSEENFTFVGHAEEKNKNWDWRFIRLRSL